MDCLPRLGTRYPPSPALVPRPGLFWRWGAGAAGWRFLC